ncbi:MAG: CDP-glycerol glycerophosphotransferase family protein [Proteobacteria bacterium]|nr:CDP-glycerol glycerophosphotransferase family protein [Pseudomonadota bacterium]MBU4470428.1 CDP-glycerol glycerophosphotransferase family protein [Pseudomonadota bacterium]MCG2753481.1 CDP-glycerol glycerophosphotransferase family protein [Desulfobacteraceae bacterium]
MRFFRVAGKAIIPIFAPLLWIFVLFDKVLNRQCGRKTSKNRKILLIAQNKVAADHIRLIWNLLKDDPRLDLFVSDDQLVNRHFSKSDLKRIVEEKTINILQALFFHWDLIIFVNHPWGLGVWFAPFIKKIYVNHGICTGKINNEMGEDGVYGRSRVIRPFHRPFYDKMFASSSFEKEYGVLSTKELQSRIVTTGFLRADLIEKLNEEKKVEIRKRMGLSDKIVVHIISTWGPTSLFQTIGEELLFEAIRISNRYKFIFSLHPRHDEFGDVRGRKRKDIIEKYKSQGIEPVDELAWDEYVVAADLAVSDHSSLCLYYILLNKPVILVPVKGESYIKNSAFNQLMKYAFTLKNPENLGNLIQIALKNPNQEKMSRLGRTLRNYPGQGADRYKEEIYGMLNLWQ